jgi:hypothetical protein
MSLTAAAFLVTWAALILLYLALARVFYELRALRAGLAPGTTSPTASNPSIRLSWTWPTGERRIVLAVDSSCAACWAAVEEAADATAVQAVAPTVLLTHEPAARWKAVEQKFDVRVDEQAWSALAHLSAPILLWLNSNGHAEEIVLPAKPGEVREAINRWNGKKEDDRDTKLVENSNN